MKTRSIPGDLEDNITKFLLKKYPRYTIIGYCLLFLPVILAVAYLLLGSLIWKNYSFHILFSIVFSCFILSSFFSLLWTYRLFKRSTRIAEKAMEKMSDLECKKISVNKIQKAHGNRWIVYHNDVRFQSPLVIGAPASVNVTLGDENALYFKFPDPPVEIDKESGFSLGGLWKYDYRLCLKNMPDGLIETREEMHKKKIMVYVLEIFCILLILAGVLLFTCLDFCECDLVKARIPSFIYQIMRTTSIIVCAIGAIIVTFVSCIFQDK